MSTYRNLLIVSCKHKDFRETVLPLIMDEHAELNFDGLDVIPDELTRSPYYLTDKNKYEVNLPPHEKLRTLTFQDLINGNDYTLFETGKSIKKLLNCTAWKDSFLETNVVQYFLKEVTECNGDFDEGMSKLMSCVYYLIKEIQEDQCKHNYGFVTEKEYREYIFGSSPYVGSHSLTKVDTCYIPQTNEYVIHFLTTAPDDLPLINAYKWLQLFDDRFCGMNARLICRELPHSHIRPAFLVVPSRALDVNKRCHSDRNAPAILMDVPEVTSDFYMLNFDVPGMLPIMSDVAVYDIPQHERLLSVTAPLESADYWFKTAAPNSNLKNLISQLKVHYEEVNECTVALRKLLDATGEECIDALFTEEHINNGDLQPLWIELVDAFGDQIVTATGALRYLGVPPNRVMSSITASNLSKFENGFPVRKVDGGKIMKGEFYLKVDLDFSVFDMQQHMKGWVYNPDLSSNLQLNELTKEGLPNG